MRKTRLALVSVFSVLILALFADPVAAQASASAELINDLNSRLLYVAFPITLLVEFILLYAVVKFRNNDNPLPTKENRRLEITWTVATAIILLFVGVASYGVLADDNVTHQPEEELQGDPVVVHAEAYQWGWEMSYPEDGNFTTGTEIVVPKDRPVVFEVTSRDVIHGFHVPKMGMKTDAMPGQINTVKTVPYEEDTYQGYCTEYCGVAHSQMYFSVEVVSQEEYQTWLSEQQNSSSSGNSASVEGTVEASALAQ
ncbi:cytochrome c oxidase subunit II [Halogeometricum borinquense DSM 11551]|uniref:cytochrome-c oxidase n=2 Tax=Halogeometricum borinquense TaxID=60847 RepID=E4NQ10_HALBP|nr:cytochrome c oxidase subunit II [Halogeometricum borinquense]ADQ67755.1 cytochrome c oxidase, subunit II [Halogeometricum borinquense DSM 11551]ELY23563.1 cytochrome c oxidase subunit II [Halogeometricum borinquense DSM 11551]RYJ13306.1 cytochrome c oxidase subunit II [Halogeometricum borinquense]